MEKTLEKLAREVDILDSLQVRVHRPAVATHEQCR